MPRLIAVVAAGGPWFVDVLRDVWDRGDALLPVDPRLPDAARARLLAAMAPHELIGPDGSRRALGDAVPVMEGDALVGVPPPLTLLKYAIEFRCHGYVRF